MNQMFNRSDGHDGRNSTDWKNDFDVHDDCSTDHDPGAAISEGDGAGDNSDGNDLTDLG